MSDTLNDLIARLEAAEGPSRELDARITAVLNNPGKPFEEINWIAAEAAWGAHAFPLYTASIDAAMTLVPKGWHILLSDWEHAKLRERGPWQCIITQPGTRDTFEPRFRCDHAPTPALALCIAALRARQGGA